MQNPRQKGPRISRRARDIPVALARALAALIADVASDPRRLKPGELIRLLNSTPAGQVIDDRRLRSHRAKAGMRVGDDKTIDLFRYAAWLHDQLRLRPVESDESATRLAAELGISSSMLHRWFGRGCPRGDLAAIETWRRENLLPRQGGPGAIRGKISGAQKQILLARRDKERQQARAIKLKTDILEGKLVEKADVVREYAEQFAVARSILDGLPDALAKESPAEIRTAAFTLARNRVDAVLRLLSQLADA
jgi:hypothetical protein